MSCSSESNVLLQHQMRVVGTEFTQLAFLFKLPHLECYAGVHRHSLVL